jgi:hypothetical protein
MSEGTHPRPLSLKEREGRRGLEEEFWFSKIVVDYRI